MYCYFRRQFKIHYFSLVFHRLLRCSFISVLTDGLRLSLLCNDIFSYHDDDDDEVFSTEAERTFHFITAVCASSKI